MSSVFDNLSRLEQLMRNPENTSIKRRTAEVLYKDRYETIVSDMRSDWKYLDVPTENERKLKNGKNKLFNFISDSSVCGDDNK